MVVSVLVLGDGVLTFYRDTEDIQRRLIQRGKIETKLIIFTIIIIF
jgi:hypothetical protein